MNTQTIITRARQGKPVSVNNRRRTAPRDWLTLAGYILGAAFVALVAVALF